MIIKQAEMFWTLLQPNAVLLIGKIWACKAFVTGMSGTIHVQLLQTVLSSMLQQDIIRILFYLIHPKTHFRNMAEWLSMLSSAARRSGHFFRSSTRKNMALHSFFSSASFSFNSLVPAE